MNFPFNGPMIPTSKGWRMCVICGGSPINVMLFSIASFTTLRLTCVSWLSINNRTGRLEPQWGIKISLNHVQKRSESTYPVSDVLNNLCPGVPFLYDVWGRVFWKMMNFCKTLPFAEAHINAVIWPDDDDETYRWYACSPLTAKTFVFDFSFPFHPVSSQLKILSGWSLSSSVLISFI